MAALSLQVLVMKHVHVCEHVDVLSLGAIAGVPFVDVLTTMLDETIPLTVVEVRLFIYSSSACFRFLCFLTHCVQWEEWGNPNHPSYYNYMKSYSPVDNVKFENGPYPPILIKGRTQ